MLFEGGFNLESKMANRLRLGFHLKFLPEKFHLSWIWTFGEAFWFTSLLAGSAHPLGGGSNQHLVTSQFLFPAGPRDSPEMMFSGCFSLSPRAPMHHCLHNCAFFAFWLCCIDSSC